MSRLLLALEQMRTPLLTLELLVVAELLAPELLLVVLMLVRGLASAGTLADSAYFDESTEH